MDCKAPRDRCFFNAIRRQIAWRNTRAFIKLSAETKGRSACTLPDLIRMGAVVHMTVNTATGRRTSILIRMIVAI